VISQHQVDAVTDAAGIIVLDGAPLSHNMIRLLGLGIPTVGLDARLLQQLPADQPVLLDGSNGRVEPAPPGQPFVAAVPAAPAAGTPIHTADGAAVQLLASVRDADSVRRALASGAAAIGLVRSEYCQPPDDAIPDVAFYHDSFRALCAAAGPLPVAIRLLDASPDKHPAWLPPTAGFGQPLGLEGVRLFGSEPVRGVIEAQLQAMAELAGDYPLQVILPYLTRYEEMRHWAERLRRVLPPSVDLGAMVETPASALDLAGWFDNADFVAVGCNDLMQGLFAADRDRPELAAYLDPYAPLLYRLLRQMAEAAGSRLHRVRLCGVLPQLQGVLPLLVGLGYRAFSVDPAHIPYLARTVAGLTTGDAERLSRQVCQARESAEVRALLGLPPSGQGVFVA
jgi:phosphoenolpyruvate-protein kinase (PTS system EI component)